MDVKVIEGSRYLATLPEQLPDGQTSGQIDLSVPFLASYVGVLNNTNATIYLAVGRPSALPAGAVPFEPGAYLSIPFEEGQKYRAFWTSSSAITAGNDSVTFLFSNLTIPIQGTKMGQTAASNVAVMNTITSVIEGSDGTTDIPVKVGADGTVYTAVTSMPVIEEGTSNEYNITAATVVKASAGRVAKVSVIVAGTAAGSVNDATTTGGASAANQIASIPNAVGVVDLNWPCTSGIVVTPGAGQTLAISYS